MVDLPSFGLESTGCVPLSIGVVFVNSIVNNDLGTFLVDAEFLCGEEWNQLHQENRDIRYGTRYSADGLAFQTYLSIR